MGKNILLLGLFGLVGFFAASPLRAQSLEAKVRSTEPASCPQKADGSASVSVNGSQGALEVFLNPSPTGVKVNALGSSVELSKLPAGNYMITLKDGAGKVGAIQLLVTSKMAPYQIQTTQPSCASCADGRIQIIAEGLKIRWSNVSLSGSSLTGLSAGSYRVELSEGSCKVVETIILK